MKNTKTPILNLILTGLIPLVALLLVGCVPGTQTPQIPSEPYDIPASSDSPSDYETVDVYQKWAQYDQRRAEQDKWDEFAQTKRHQLEADADLSDEWIDCERDVSVDVSLENTGDVAEDDVFVTLDNDKLGIHSAKFADELLPGHFTIVRFPLVLDDSAPGDYEFAVRVFREQDELEGMDTVELKVRECS